MRQPDWYSRKHWKEQNADEKEGCIDRNEDSKTSRRQKRRGVIVSPSLYIHGNHAVIVFYQNLNRWKPPSCSLSTPIPFSLYIHIYTFPHPLYVCLIQFRAAAQRNGNNGIHLTVRWLELLLRWKCKTIRGRMSERKQKKLKKSCEMMWVFEYIDIFKLKCTVFLIYVYAII